MWLFLEFPRLASALAFYGDSLQLLDERKSNKHPVSHLSTGHSSDEAQALGLSFRVTLIASGSTAQI